MAEIQVNGGLEKYGQTPPLVQISSSIAPFVPSQLPGLVLWLRGDLGITIGTGVSAWADQSGNGNNASQATGSKQPTLKLSDPAYGGQATLSFASGSAQSMTLAALLPAEPFTAYVVGESTSGASQQEFFADGNNRTLYFNNTDWALYDGANATSSNTTQGSALAFCGVSDGVNVALYINASSPAAASHAATGLTASGTETIGSQGTSFYLNGKMAELIVYNQAHDPSHIQRVFQYFGSRYGQASWQ